MAKSIQRKTILTRAEWRCVYIATKIGLEFSKQQLEEKPSKAFLLCEQKILRFLISKCKVL